MVGVKKGGMRVTLKDVAGLAGVSVSTVSKAFSGSKEVSEETRQMIFQIARENNCFDKYNKNKYNKKVIAVICPEIISDYYASMLKMLEEEIHARSGIMTVSCSNFSAQKVEELYAYYSSYCRADGIIIIGNNGNLKNPYRIPSVSITSSVECANVDTIEVSNFAAIEGAIRHLKELGHRKIAFAGEPLTLGSERQFRIAMENAELSVQEELVCTGTRRFEEAGMEAVKSWMEKGICPTAVLAAYDYIAIGVIKALRSHGYRVPEDISVVGMNDISIIPYLDPPLSTIKNYSEDFCRVAVDLIMEKIRNPYHVNREPLVFEGKFVVRGSTAKRKEQKK